MTAKPQNTDDLNAAFNKGMQYQRSRMAAFVVAEGRAVYKAGEVLDLIDNILEHKIERTKRGARRG